MEKKKKTMKENLQSLKDWIDGKSVMIDADKYIVTREKREKIDYSHVFSVHRVKEDKGAYQLLCVFISFLFIVLLLMVVLTLPKFGEASNPANNEVMERYIEQGIEETGATNFVTGMILDYRAFDTFGEASVLFLSVMCVVMLLRRDENNVDPVEDREIFEDEQFDKKEHRAILKVGTRFLAPVIMFYGVYVILNGHLSPGGGFSGGAIVGAGLILYAAAYGSDKMKEFFTFRTFTMVSIGCLLTYFVCKSYSFFTGANHVGYEIPKGIPGNIISSGFILPLNICVGLVVACTMYGFYALFTKGDI